MIMGVTAVLAAMAFEAVMAVEAVMLVETMEAVLAVVAMMAFCSDGCDVFGIGGGGDVFCGVTDFEGGCNCDSERCFDGGGSFGSGG
ncbi:hypothetical protein DPMN_091090 [Dreissena polymorpha]|uniref:Secreted protein n=1 Tax=Dreissena polymorpha TaxID=45954 RepID=A0A9D4KZE9_DREPO|nr:hypothetical protein DPMN_091090 [Dreissena polymorpha]